MRNLPKNKKLTDILLTTLLIPYLLLVITMGGFHDIITAKECEHINFKSGNEFNIQIQDRKIIDQHDSDSCQICQWLKTSPTSTCFPSFETKLGCAVYTSALLACPFLPTLSIDKYTIRPPPSFSCIIS